MRLYVGWLLCACVLIGCGSSDFGGAPIVSIDANHEVAVIALDLAKSGMLFDLKSQARPLNASPDQMLEWEKTSTQGLEILRKTYGDETKFEFLDGAEFNLAQDEGQIGAIKFQMKADIAPSEFTMPVGSNNQVYVIFKAQTPSGITQHIHVLFWPIEDEWKVAEMSVSFADLKGNSFSDVYDAGLDQQQTGQLVNALALFSLAERMSHMPSFRVAGIKAKLQEAANKTATELQYPRNPLGSYKVNGNEEAVVALAVVMTDQEPYLQIHNRIAEKLGTEEYIRERQVALAKSFAAGHPALKEYFSGVGVSTVSMDPKEKRSGYRKVYSFELLEKAEAAKNEEPESEAPKDDKEPKPEQDKEKK
ncbi:MAG: hypothetical protein CMJ78_26585 [Planctomycetaceae bacterium]|nr:hypothetical protein [Planctomycetaceae bacterium]